MNEDIILENEILMVVYSRFPFLGFYSWDVTDRHKMNERKTQDQENKRHNLCSIVTDGKTWSIND